MNRIISGLAMSLLLIATFSVSASEESTKAHYEAPQLSPSVALQLAQEKAEESGYKLELFKLAGFRYDYVDREWFLVFKEREFTGALGAHFVVQIVEGKEIEVILDRGI